MAFEVLVLVLRRKLFNWDTAKDWVQENSLNTSPNKTVISCRCIWLEWEQVIVNESLDCACDSLYYHFIFLIIQIFFRLCPLLYPFLCSAVIVSKRLSSSCTIQHSLDSENWIPVQHHYFELFICACLFTCEVLSELHSDRYQHCHSAQCGFGSVTALYLFSFSLLNAVCILWSSNLGFC